VAALDKHFTVSELASLWHLSKDTIRSLFRDEPGVLKLDAPETRSKRGYCTLRIPESVAQRVHVSLARRGA
jgi:hypothetical protein